MKNPRGPIEQPENNEDCRVLAPFVMTLFDGEADETEARRARAHLLVCQTCAHRWLDWNRSRDLLQCAPVPAPPPHLLWRVLMACRLTMPSPRTMAAPTPPVPRHISDQILARTTRANFISTPRRHFSPFKLSALAVPAAAAWMMVLERENWLPEPALAPPTVAFNAPNNFVEEQLSAPSPAKTRRLPRGAAPRIRASRPAVTRRAPAFPMEESNEGRFDGLSVSSQRQQQTEAAPTFAAVTNEAEIRRAPATSSTEPLRRTVPAEVRGAVMEEFDAPQRVSSGERTIPARVVTARLTALVAKSSTPGLRAARWRLSSLSVPVNVAPAGAKMVASSPNVTASPSQTLRVSMPSAAAPQPVRLLAENLDSDDASIEEIRSVVDDFRAALDSEAAPSADSSSIDEENVS